MRITWIHPDVVGQVRAALLGGVSSWEELFTSDDEVRVAAPPAGIEVTPEAWPRLAGHVARAERVRETVERSGLAAATRRFGPSSHAVERAALLAAGPEELHASAFAGILACPIDEFMAYGHFLSRLVELGAAADPAGTVAAFERFVDAASRVASDQPSWPERLRVARDGLAALYVRVGRREDADALYRERYAEEPADTTVAIGAARAFLEAGDTHRALTWLELATGRAASLGRDKLAARLREKTETLRARMN